jgi:hypothetical protein
MLPTLCCFQAFCPMFMCGHGSETASVTHGGVLVVDDYTLAAEVCTNCSSCMPLLACLLSPGKA